MVKIEFRHFPLDIVALNASKISQCKQDQSLEIMMSLYSDQQAWIKGKTIEEANENLKKFVKNKNFTEAAEEMLNSRWAGQVGQRAVRLSKMMESDVYPF